MSDQSTVDSPDAVRSLEGFLLAIDHTTRSRGTRYQRNGRVVRLVRSNDHSLAALVQGGQLYHVTLSRHEGSWYGTCSCPMAEDCKHVVATALAWREQLLGQGVAGGASVPPGAFAPKPTFRQQWEPILADKLGRPLTPDEGAFLGRLSHLFHNLQQSGALWAHELAQLGFATNESRQGHYHRAFQGWWQTAPADPLALWQYIAYDLESSGAAVPPFMRPITDTSLVRRDVEARHRREVVARWGSRFSQMAAADHSPQPARAGAEREPRSLDLRLVINPSQWSLETRDRPEAPWKTMTRTQLDHLTRENSLVLADIEASPAVYAFIALCQEHRRRHYAVELKPDGYGGGRELLHRLLLRRLTRSLVVDPAGQPLVFSPDRLTWQLAPAAGGDRDYEIFLCLPDGSRLPPAALYLPGQPDLYLHQNTVYHGPPALDGNSATGAVVPAEALEEPTTLGFLQRHGTKLLPEIEARCVHVAMHARIECSLVEDGGSLEALALKLFAVSEVPRVQRVWTQFGWNAAPAVRRDDASVDPQKIYSFDLAGPAKAAASLAELKVYYDDLGRYWTRRLTKAFPEEFLAWRAALGSQVEVVATGELASLLGGPVRARVDFELLETKAHHDWFDLALALKPEDSTLTADEIALLLKARGKLVRIPGKGWRRLAVEIEENTAEALTAAGFDPASLAESALAGEKHRLHALQLAQSTLADHLPERQAAELRRRAQALTRADLPAVPEGLQADLRPYQLEGYHFLVFLAENRLGGILADDMGLGKTVQTLAWLLWLASRRPADDPLQALVVCPKSVMGTWETEAAKFAPGLATVRFQPAMAGAGRAAVGMHLVIANYAQLRHQAEHFTGQAWHAVILDEGQFIKTPTSKVAQIARELPGPHRLVLTGTPIENRLLDLWSLFAFALPGLLGTQAAFKRQHDQDDALALARLRARVRHFLLRRTKAQVAADLPPRTEEDVVVELEGEQAKLYQAELKRARAQLLKVGTLRDLDRMRFNILASLLRLRQICCHPGLVDAAHDAAPSAKLDALLDRLIELRDEGHQVLVFSQFVQMLERIREKLVAAEIGHLLLTGQTEDRDALVQQFQSDKRQTVFLLSLKAAGFGLNLTAASYAILYDPWWNPAVEAQAIDRTHRIGQTMPVTAYRLLARGTVEEKIRALQREKAALAGAIVQEESLASVLDLESLRQILA